MAQQRGSAVTLVIDTETTYKTDPAAPDAMILPFKSASIGLNREQIQSQTIRNSRNPNMPVRGKSDVAGDISFELAPQYGRLLKHVFGSYAVTGASAPYTHTFKVGDLPVGMVLEKAFTDLATDKFFKYNGLKVSSFNCSCQPSGIIEASVNLMGAKETIGTSAYDATATDLGHTPFDGFEGSVYQGGSSSGIVTGFDFSIDNDLDGEVHVIDGTGQRYSLPEGIAKVTGKITTLFESDTLYALAIADTETSLALHFTKGAGTGASAGNEKMSFYFDEVKLRPSAIGIPGPKGLLVNLDFVAYYDNDADASAARCVLLTPQATF